MQHLRRCDVHAFFYLIPDDGYAPKNEKMTFSGDERLARGKASVDAHPCVLV